MLLARLDSLVKIDGSHFPHAVFDHLGREEVLLSLSLHRNFPIIFL